MKTKFFIPLLLVSISYISGFDACKFNFGKGWTEGTNLNGMDFASIYAGDGGFNQYHHGKFLEETKAANVTPIFYGYITAFMAREQDGLLDCDLGTPNLCQQGSAFIRNHRAAILDIYTLYSQKIAQVWGNNASPIWIVEPDLYQYSSLGSNQRKLYNGQTQTGGGLTGTELKAFFSDIVARIHQYTPNAKIAIDISPWIQNPIAYYNYFDKSIINFGATSGGRTAAADTLIRTGDRLTWKSAHSAIGKPILADCGYGVGGSKDGHHSEWDNLANINARIADGVISINQFDARADWLTSVLTSLRPQISNWCPIPIIEGRSPGNQGSIQGTLHNGLLELWNVESGATIEVFDAMGHLIHREWGHGQTRKTKLARISNGPLLVRQTGNSGVQSISIPVIP